MTDGDHPLDDARRYIRAFNRGGLAGAMRELADIVAPIPTDLETAKAPYHALHARSQVRQHILSLAKDVADHGPRVLTINQPVSLLFGDLPTDTQP